jgi:hypothetical protein
MPGNFYRSLSNFGTLTSKFLSKNAPLALYGELQCYENLTLLVKREEIHDF